MADNYLERRMDDYRAGRLNKPHQSANASAVLKYPSLRVMVTGDGRLFEAVVSRLRSLGLRVAFIGGSDTLAQQTGARRYPQGALSAIDAHIADTWGGLDISVGVGETPPYEAPIMISATSVNGLTDEDTALLVVFALHPLSHRLLASGAFSGLTLYNKQENG